MFQAKIRVTLRQSILDPQGKAVEHGIAALGFHSVKNVRVGKYIVMEVHAADREEAERVAGEVCRKLLANPVMEDYRVTLEEMGEKKRA